MKLLLINNVLLSLIIVASLGAQSPVIKKSSKVRQPAKITKESITQAISNSHVPLFSKDDLFVEKLDQDDIEQWYQAVNAARQFILDKKVSSEVKKYLSTIIDANNTLINSIKLLFNTNFNNTQPILQNLEQAYDESSHVVEKVEEIIKKPSLLGRAKSLFNIGKKEQAGKKDAIDILNFLAQYVSTTLKTSINHLQKRA